MRQALAIAATILLVACGSGEKAEADKLAATLSGSDKPANAQCALYTQAEIAALSGEAVAPGRSAASGLGCQWMASDGSGSTIVTVTVPANHVETSGADGYRALPDVGDKGFVAGKPGGWTAAAIRGDKAVFVSIDSDKTSEANVIDLLKQTLAKVAT